MEKPQGKYDVWDWIVTKNGDVRQITHDDMMDLKYEDIERHAKIEEMPAEVSIEAIRNIIDNHINVTEARQFLAKYASLGKFRNSNAYSEYTALKAIQEAINHYKYDFSESCSCKSSSGQTWCCNNCGLPTEIKATL